MSFEATTEVWEKSTRSGSHKLVLLCIAHHQNSDSNKAWPSIDRIAAMCGLKRRQVFDILRELCESGEIKRESGAKKGKVNRYTVTITASEGVRPSAPPCAVERTPTSAADRTPPVRPSAPESSLKESSESSAELKEGRRSAAMSVNDLVQRGLSSEVAERLLSWHVAKGKRSINCTEFESFAAEVARAPGYTVSEVAESISLGEYCAYLPNFSAKHLPPHRSTLYAAPKWSVDAPSEQRQALVRRDEIERYDDAAPFSLGARAQALGALRRAGFDPLLQEQGDLPVQRTTGQQLGAATPAAQCDAPVSDQFDASVMARVIASNADPYTSIKQVAHLTEQTLATTASATP